MVSLESWENFERDIIYKEKNFFLYGAGLIYQKIYHLINNNVNAVIDIRAKEINKTERNVMIIEPKEIEKFCLKSNSFIAILCALNPFNDYLERTKEVIRCLQENNPKQRIKLYCVDYEKIVKTGVIDWGEEKYLLDNMLFMVNEAYKMLFMKAAYNQVENYSQLYMQKMYEEPIEPVISKKRIGLRDFNNGFISHVNGKKETIRRYSESYYKHSFWIFGDSRVSGMLIENKHTFATFLQEKFDQNLISYKVINCGIPGRDIERMVYQIENEDIRENDYVILATGFYEYEGNIHKKAVIWSQYIKDAALLCKKKNANFVYVSLPTILEMDNINESERLMLDIYNKTEFINYNYEMINNYKHIIHYNCNRDGVFWIDFANAFKKREIYGQVFVNLHHYGPNGNRLIGDELYKIYRFIESEKKSYNSEIFKEKELRSNKFNERIHNIQSEEESLQIYIDDILNMLKRKEVKMQKRGCIVMNANPFTNGHMYLVNQALKYVDLLIVFVVSEDKSFFTFDERFEIVYENLKTYSQVLIVPSGNFLISQSTFPEYFIKEDIQKEKVNARKDLELFAEKIAPALNISYRFVGEEPEDCITKQYNEAMKKILPNYNINVIEIPRISEGNNVISASTVRNLIKERNIEDIKDLVPETTWLFIKHKYMEYNNSEKLERKISL